VGKAHPPKVPGLRVDHLEKRILIVTNSISGGGAEISMLRLFRTLKTFGVDVNLCVINEQISESIAKEGVTSMGRQWSSGATSTIRALIRFRRYLELNRPQIIVINCELPELFAAIATPRKMRLIAVEHTSKPWYRRRFLGFMVRYWLKARDCSWVTVSRECLPVWPSNLSPRFIPNTHLPADAKVKNLSPSDLVFVGRLNYEKHPEIAAEAAVISECTLKIFGDGPDYEKIKKSSPPSLVKLLGFIENPWSQISSESILIVPSEFEGDGMIVVEAISNNNPVLLADNSDLRRFSFPERNYFVDTSDLVSKILAAKKLGIGELRINQNQRDLILRERNALTVARQWIDLFNEELN
jgi:glycosyltransferase involved in cell wall biosynthesis